MCIIISPSLHIYFTTFDMIFEIHTDIHVKSTPLPINPVKQYTKFNGEGHVAFVVKISLHTPFCGGCGKCSFEKN